MNLERSHADLLEALKNEDDFIISLQKIAVSYLEPGRLSATSALSALIEMLDCERQRAVQGIAQAAIARAQAAQP